MVNSIVKKCKKKLIFSSIVLILIVSMIFYGYFSDGVMKIITTNAKITSQEYITRVLKEDIVDGDLNLFYDAVSEDGIVFRSFDVNKANLVLANTRSKLERISGEFNENNNFSVYVPVSYLFIPTSYILPNIKLNVETSSLLYYEAKLKTEIKEYGINSSMVSLILTVDIKYQVTVPLMYEIVDNSIDIPLSIEVISGKIPEVLLNI